jgi:hypothetical protein
MIRSMLDWLANWALVKPARLLSAVFFGRLNATLVARMSHSSYKILLSPDISCRSKS